MQQPQQMEFPRILDFLSSEKGQVSQELLWKLLEFVQNSQKTVATSLKKVYQSLCATIHAVYETKTQTDEQKMDDSGNKENVLVLVRILKQIFTYPQKQPDSNIQKTILSFLVGNLGHEQTEIRKNSHYSLLSFVHKFNNMEKVIDSYLHIGVKSNNPKLKQKAVNSFQSLFIAEGKNVNWHSQKLKDILSNVIQALEDDNAHVRKACQQCLLTVSKCPESVFLFESIPPNVTSIWKEFNLRMQEKGLLYPPVESPSRPALLARVESIRRQILTPFQSTLGLESKTKKAESLGTVKRSERAHHYLPTLRKSVHLDPNVDNGWLDKKLLEDLKNEKDWKTRLEAVEELKRKINDLKQHTQQIPLVKNTLVPLVVKVFDDNNFKISVLGLKMIEDLFEMEIIQVNQIAKQMINKLNDPKISLRQNVSRLIFNQYMRKHDKRWIQEILQFIHKANLGKQEGISILMKIFEQKGSSQQLERILETILESVCPLMDDPKTKIKMRALQLLVLITNKTSKPQFVRSFVCSKLSQIYNQMYIEKLPKTQTPKKEQKSFSQSRKTQAESFSQTKKKFGNTTSENLSKTHHSQGPPFRTMLLLGRSRRVKMLDPRGDTLHRDNLHPLKSTQGTIKGLVQGLKSDDWEVCSQSVTTLRRVLCHHPQLITKTILRDVVPELARSIDSLRSSLSRNAVVAMGELLEQYGKWIDHDLEIAYSKLIRKTLQTNQFLHTEVLKSLKKMSLHCSEAKLLGLLGGSCGSKAVGVKMGVLEVLGGLVGRGGDVQRVVGMLQLLMQDGALQVRDSAKSILIEMLNSEKSEDVKKILSADLIAKLQSYRPNSQLQILNRSSDRIQAFNLTNQTNQTNTSKKWKTSIHKQSPNPPLVRTQSHDVLKQPLSPQKPRKATRNPQNPQSPPVPLPPIFSTLEQHLQILLDPSPQVKLSGLEKLEQEIIGPYPQIFGGHKLCGKTTQILLKLCSHSNTKVALKALSILDNMIAGDKKVVSGVEANMAVAVNQMFRCLGAAKQEIRDKAQGVLRELAHIGAKHLLVQYFCQGVLYSTPRARILGLECFIKILPSIFEEASKKVLLNKSLVTLVNKLVQEDKNQFREGLIKLINFCQNELKDDFIHSLTDKAKQVWAALQANGK